MNLSKYIFILATMLIFVTQGPAMAQKKGAFELGFDIGGSYITDDRERNVQTILIPIPNFRLGYCVTKRFEIETGTTFEYGKFEHKVTSTKHTTWNLFSSLVYNHYRGPDAVMPFVQFGGGFIRRSFSASGAMPESYSDSQTRGFAVFSTGVKIPQSGQLSIRVAADAKFYAEGKSRWHDPWELHIGGTIGLSFFTR